MKPAEYRVGMLVTHPRKPEWGPGKVLAVNGPIVKVFFRDREVGPGKHPVFDIKVTDMPLSMAVEQQDPWLDHLPLDKAGKPVPGKRHVTLDQAIRTLLAEYPLGFSDPRYLGDKKQGERVYKWEAHQLWEETLGGGQGELLLEVGKVTDVTRLAQKVLSAVNLLAVFEVTAMRDGLKDPKAAEAFFMALFALLATKEPAEGPFEALVGAVQNLPVKGKTHPDKWTVVTILPFLARPDTFMFLKPEITKHAAELLGFDLGYDARPNWRTYRRLLELAARLMERLKPLGAHDWIDVQSFMWLICERHAPPLRPSKSR